MSMPTLPNKHFLEAFRDNFNIPAPILYKSLKWSRQRYYDFIKFNRKFPLDKDNLKILTETGVSYGRIRKFVNTFLKND